MDQEQIALEIDERPAVTSIGKANAAMDDYEKRVSKASGTANQAFQNYGENIIRITDRSRSSIERLVASIEKQAETYGKTGVERLVSQRDLLIKRLGDEQQAVDRVRAAYEASMGPRLISRGNAYRVIYSIFNDLHAESRVTLRQGAESIINQLIQSSTFQLSNNLHRASGQHAFRAA